MISSTHAARPPLDTGIPSSGTARRSRAIGPAGTIARILGGGTMVASVILAELSGGFTPLEWTLALVAFPAVLSRRNRRGSDTRSAPSMPPGRPPTSPRSGSSSRCI